MRWYSYVRLRLRGPAGVALLVGVAMIAAAIAIVPGLARQPGIDTVASTKTLPKSQPKTPKNQTGGSSTASGQFDGIYAFSGGNTADLATDPDVAGRSLVYYWRQLEPSQGHYDWSPITKDMQPWVQHNKKVILRVSASGWASWDKAADSGNGTPQWVYDQGVKSVTEQDGAILPQYWNPIFLNDLKQFLIAFGKQFDGNANVELVDISVGVGGETKPDSEKNPKLLSLWQGIGYTDAVWWTTVQQIITDYTDVFHKTPLALMPDKTFLGSSTTTGTSKSAKTSKSGTTSKATGKSGTTTAKSGTTGTSSSSGTGATGGYNEHLVVAYAVGKGIWLQDNGLVPGRTLSSPWGQTPVISEQRGPTSQTGDSLTADLDAALADKARIILVFTSDLTTANSSVIHQVASQAKGGS